MSGIMASCNSRVFTIKKKKLTKIGVYFCIIFIYYIVLYCIIFIYYYLYIFLLPPENSII